ncbi:hypothetical protein [Gilvimarinus agarilyticus]|uniref:hypothetical protein n=1 Tax=Gilvimarinus agarilyticus TaxID=679259 RepID=UPI0005A0F4B2|nr:hypothetical protein [Gilvimarinus agarilyticus]
MHNYRALFKLTTCMGLFAGIVVGVFYAAVEFIKGNLVDAVVILLVSPVLHVLMFGFYFLLAIPGYRLAIKKSLFGLDKIVISQED